MVATVAFRLEKHKKNRKMLPFGTQTKRNKNCVFTIKLIEYGVKLKWHFILFYFFCAARQFHSPRETQKCMIKKLQQRKVKHFPNTFSLILYFICFV